MTFFLITALKKFGFGEAFIDWIRILLINKESCVIKGATTTQSTSNLKKVQDEETQFVLIYLFFFLKLPLFALKKINILRY